MKYSMIARIAVKCAVAGLCATGPAEAESVHSTLTPFHNEAEFRAYVEPIRIAEERRNRAQSSGSTGNIFGTTVPGGLVVVENPSNGFRREVVAGPDGSYSMRSLPVGTYKVTDSGKTHDVQVQVQVGNSASLDSVAVVGGQISQARADEITNVQTPGVDEGGIVKKAGDFLIVLRRGRLFSIRANGSDLQSISAVNAYAPGIDPVYDWYDEMLVSGNRLVVVGYSYRRGGTEIGLFNLGTDGTISHRATYHLSSSDYYSSRNYASRLAGDTLIFYSPVPLLSPDYKQANFPGLRRWKGQEDGAFERIAPAEHIYRSGIAEGSPEQVLHTITRCKLSDADIACDSTAVLGPWSSTFYVSRDAAYVWMTSWGDWSLAPGRKDEEESALLRLPLDGSAPSGLRTLGSPIDQLSFLEQGGYLNVLLGTEAKGDRMWAAESNVGRLALLRVPLDAFGDLTVAPNQEQYRVLPTGASEDLWGLSNRYVGEWLLYGAADDRSATHAVRVDRSDPATQLRLPHPVERIEAIGKDALLVGSERGDLYLSTVDLAERAEAAGRMTLRNATQGDDRTHGFFYRAQSDDEGLFGLPIVHGDDEGASIQFLRNDRLRLRQVGGMTATAPPVRDEDADGCTASCYDWYGDARPIFISDRIYGLMGYELVEGRLQGGRVREVRRLDFSPRPARVSH